MYKEMLNSCTVHFRVFYEEADRDFTEKLIGRIEEFYLDVCRKAGCSPGDKTYDLYICGSVEDFLLYTGKSSEDYQDWMVGNTDMEKNRLCVASPRVSGDMSEGYEKYLIQVMLHEVVHIVFDSICGPEKCDIWIAEGVAVWLAGQTVAEYISEEAYPRIASLGGREDFDAFVDNGGYTYSGVYVWYLTELYGMERFLSVYRGEKPVADLLEEGFEHRAITAYKKKAL